MQREEIKQYKEFSLYMIQLSSDCFKDCVTDFSADKLKSEEIKCVSNCASRAMTQHNEMHTIMGQIDQKYGDRF